MRLSSEDMRRIAESVRKTENDMRLHSPGPAADRIVSQEPFALNHKNRKVNLVAPTAEPSGGSKLYPAKWYSFDRDTTATSAERECWAFEPNDNELKIGHIYTNAQRVGIRESDGLPIYAIDDDDAVESGSGADGGDGDVDIDGGDAVFVPPNCTYSGGDGVQIDVVTDVCPIFSEICGVEQCASESGSLPGEDIEVGSGGSALVMTGINVEKTPICLGTEQVGTPFCDTNPICCEDPTDLYQTICCENPLPATLFATFSGAGDFCLLGKTVELTWNPAEECWLGQDNDCICGEEACTCYLCFCCDPLSGEFSLSISQVDWCEACARVDNIDTETMNNCDPFEFSHGPSEYFCCNGSVGDQVTVVVTA